MQPSSILQLPEFRPQYTIPGGGGSPYFALNSQTWTGKLVKASEVKNLPIWPYAGYQVIDVTTPYYGFRPDNNYPAGTFNETFFKNKLVRQPKAIITNFGQSIGSGQTRCPLSAFENFIATMTPYFIEKGIIVINTLGGGSACEIAYTFPTTTGSSVSSDVDPFYDPVDTGIYQQGSFKGGKILCLINTEFINTYIKIDSSLNFGSEDGVIASDSTESLKFASDCDEIEVHFWGQEYEASVFANAPAYNAVNDTVLDAISTGIGAVNEGNLHFATGAEPSNDVVAGFPALVQAFFGP